MKTGIGICDGVSNNDTCNRMVLENTQGSTKCQLCLHWYHAECVRVSEEAYPAIETHRLMWLCGPCRDLIPELRELQASQQSLYGKQLEIMAVRMEEIQEAVIKKCGES